MDDFPATDGWPDDALDAMQHVADLARAAVPDAVIGKSYGAPAMLVDGKALIGVSRGAQHLSVVPFSPPAIEAVKGELDGFTASKGVIRFTPDAPLPDDVVVRLIALRLAEIRG
jgi:uncharacterized protein YdhG (YjbR/CyaY superfamily)